MKSTLALGEPTIDRQHAELLTALQSIRRMTSNASQEQYSETMSSVSLLIQEHFDTEEAYMQSIGIPEPMFAIHHNDHSRIIEELTALHLRTMENCIPEFQEIISSMTDWIYVHLINFDLHLKPFIERARNSQLSFRNGIG